MLAKQLAELETDGILEKRIYPTVPVKTDYRMTDLGNSLYPVIEAMDQWGNHYSESLREK